MNYKIKYNPKISLTDIEILLNAKLQEEEIKLLVDKDFGASFLLYFHNHNEPGKGMIIEHDDIITFKIYNDRFYPYIDLTFNDTKFLISNELYPDDNTKISFYKRSYAKEIKPIRIDFVITNFQLIKNKDYSDKRIYNVRAILDFPNISENIAYKGNSINTLIKISEKCELGFISNVDNSNDDMLWINTNKYTSKFIKDITIHSYIDDNSLVYTFIDLYYNLNYIDIEKQLMVNTFDQKNIITTINQLYDDNNSEIITPLLLSNHPNMTKTNSFISKFYLNNNPREINWDIGYTSFNYYYDKNNNEGVKTEIEPRIEMNNNHMIMRNMEKEQYYKKNYIGKQDIDNVHNNYLISEKMNTINLDFLMNSKLIITIYTSNMNLYRMQYVEVVIYELNSLMNLNTINKGELDENKTDSYKINEKISGKWLIIGINYTFKKHKIVQEITLVRKYMNNIYDKEKLNELTKKFYMENETK